MSPTQLARGFCPVANDFSGAIWKDDLSNDWRQIGPQYRADAFVQIYKRYSVILFTG